MEGRRVMPKAKRVTPRAHLIRHLRQFLDDQSFIAALEHLAAVEAEARDREALRLARQLYRKSLNIRGLVGQHLEAAAVEFRAEVRKRQTRRKENG